MAPKNANELEEMLTYALSGNGPVAIRYPKGEAYLGLNEFKAPMEQGKAEEVIDRPRQERTKLFLARYSCIR
jgi:1-deoxy-D-xylulose-5-phosphate synthase